MKDQGLAGNTQRPSYQSPNPDSLTVEVTVMSQRVGMQLPATLPAHGSGQASEKLVRRAWLSLVLYPASFIASFVVGELLLSSYGYTDQEPVPLWVGLAVAGPALLIASLPGMAAVWFGRRAMRLGNRDGLAPAWAGAMVSLAVVGLNGLAVVVRAFTG